MKYIKCKTKMKHLNRVRSRNFFDFLDKVNRSMNMITIINVSSTFKSRENRKRAIINAYKNEYTNFWHEEKETFTWFE